MEEERNYTFDSLKFFASIIISLLHFNWRIVPQGYLCVEFFLILSGYLIYSQRDKYRTKSFIEILQNKISSFYFYWILIMMLGLLYHGITRELSYSFGTWVIKVLKIATLFPYILGNDVVSDSFWIPFGQAWYLPVWFTASVICIMLIRLDDKRKIQYIVVAAAFLLIAIVYNATDIHNLNITMEKNIGLFSFGFMRGIQDMMIGMALGVFATLFRSHTVFKNTFYRIVVLQIIEVICLALMIFFICMNVTPEADYLFCIVVGLLLITIERRTKNNDGVKSDRGGVLAAWHKLCSLSIPIYYFHYVVIVIIRILDMDNRNKRYTGFYLVAVFLLALVGEWIQRLIKKGFFLICSRF